MQKQTASWMAPLAVGVVVLVILVVVAVTASRDDDGTVPASGDSPLAETSATSTAVTTEAVPSASTPPGVDLNKPIREAMKDDFPAMVPAEVPPGWVATGAAYTAAKGADGPVWSLTFQLPDGGVVELNQSELGLRKAVGRHLGSDAQPAGKVDLRKFGTGFWFIYAGRDPLGIGKQLPNTSVVIAAPSTDDAVTLARTLLTAEDYAMPEAG